MARRGERPRAGERKTAAKSAILAGGTGLDSRARHLFGQSLSIVMDIEAQKRAAAARALEFVRPGMRLGLGSGSTAKHFVELLAERVRVGLDVIGVPTSEGTRSDAERLGVPLTSLDETPGLDSTTDRPAQTPPGPALIPGA